VMWGVIITGLFIAFTLVLGFQPSCGTDKTPNCLNKFQKFWNSPPNEIGDTLAGLAGALAFLWIIVTVGLQSQELRAQREELAAQKDELKLTRKESEKMVSVMERQAQVFEDELKERKQNRIEQTIDASLRIFLNNVSDANVFLHHRRGKDYVPEKGLRFVYNKTVSLDQNMQQVFDSLNKILKYKNLIIEPNGITGSELLNHLDELVKILGSAETLLPGLSDAQALKFESLRTRQIKTRLGNILNLAKEQNQ